MHTIIFIHNRIFIYTHCDLFNLLSISMIAENRKILIASYSRITVEKNLKVVYNYRDIDLILRVKESTFVSSYLRRNWSSAMKTEFYISAHNLTSRQHVCNVLTWGRRWSNQSLLIIDALYLLYGWFSIVQESCIREGVVCFLRFFVDHALIFIWKNQAVVQKVMCLVLSLKLYHCYHWSD